MCEAYVVTTTARRRMTTDWSTPPSLTNLKCPRNSRAGGRPERAERPSSNSTFIRIVWWKWLVVRCAQTGFHRKSKSILCCPFETKWADHRWMVCYYSRLPAAWSDLSMIGSENMKKVTSRDLQDIRARYPWLLYGGAKRRLAFRQPIQQIWGWPEGCMSDHSY